jgi:hypothetical protein
MAQDYRPRHLVFAQRVSAIDGKGQTTLVSSYHVGFLQRGTLFFCIDTIVSSCKKLVPREGEEKGGSNVMGISVGQVIKGQEYRSVQQIKNGVPFFSINYSTE